jgi:hypothetical protein
MIMLTGPTDQLVAQVQNPSPAAGNALTCYCQWANTGGPTPFAFQVTPITFAAPAPISIANFPGPPLTMTIIQEITIANTLWSSTPPMFTGVPANVYIYKFFGPEYYQLFHCVLQAGETLCYNATPGGVNGTWQVYDTRGVAAS